jgi:hypothetical protein
MFLGLPRHGSKAVPDRRSRSNLASASAPRIVPPKNHKTVEANEFVPKDADGKVRAKIGMGLIFNTDGPAMVLFDVENSPPRISIWASEDEAKVEANSLLARASSAMWAGSPGKRGSGLGVTGPAGLFRGTVCTFLYNSGTICAI